MMKYRLVAIWSARILAFISNLNRWTRSFWYIIYLTLTSAGIRLKQRIEESENVLLTREHEENGLLL